MTVAIRPARPEDRPAIVALALEFGGYLAWNDREELVVRDDEYGERLVAAMEREAATVVVAEIDGEVRGFAAAAVFGSSGRLLHLYVGGRGAGRGAGRLLYEAIAVELRARGCVEIYADALATNRTAREFYERLGFSERTVTFRRSLD